MTDSQFFAERDAYGMARNTSELSHRLNDLDVALAELSRRDNPRRYRRAGEHIPIRYQPTGRPREETPRVPAMGDTDMIQIKSEDPPTSSGKQPPMGDGAVNDQVYRPDQMLNDRLMDTEDRVEELWFAYEAQQTKAEDLRLQSNQMRIDVVKKVMAIMVGYCVSQLCVTAIQDEFEDDSMVPHTLYNLLAALVIAFYLSKATPRMAGETFVKHSLQLGVAMSPVIMGWAFRDTVKAFYKKYVYDDKFASGTNWLVQLACALAYIIFVSLFTFLKCIRKDGLCSIDQQGSFLNYLKKSFGYTPLSIGWALNKSAQTAYLSQLNPEDIWNGFCVFAAFSLGFSALTAWFVRRLIVWTDALSEAKAESKAQAIAMEQLAGAAAESGQCLTREQALAAGLSEDRVDTLDKDGDGTIDLQEFEKAHKEQLKDEAVVQAAHLSLEMLKFLKNSVGFVFAWTWNYVITYLWFVAFFRCTDDPNNLSTCQPAPNFLLAVILTVSMWYLGPRMAVNMQTKAKMSGGQQEMVALTTQMIELTKNAMGIIVGWTWTGYISSQLTKWDKDSKISIQTLYALASLFVTVGACIFFHIYKLYEATLQKAMLAHKEERLDEMRRRKEERARRNAVGGRVTAKAPEQSPSDDATKAAGESTAKTADTEPASAEANNDAVPKA